MRPRNQYDSARTQEPDKGIHNGLQVQAALFRKECWLPNYLGKENSDLYKRIVREIGLLRLRAQSWVPHCLGWVYHSAIYKIHDYECIT